MQEHEPAELPRARLLTQNEQEVAVALHVAVAECERSLQVRADESALQNRLDVGDEADEDVVEFGIGGRFRVHWPCSVASGLAQHGRAMPAGMARRRNVRCESARR